MAKILFVWELGKGFGHIAPYLDLIRGIKKKGHNVIFVSRDVGNTEKVFGEDGVTILQAPIMMHNISNPYRVQYNLSHLIHNTGFGEIKSLFGLVKAWRHIYHYVQPDLAIFDHSPTALLASKAYNWKRIVSGSGFLIPPPGKPLPMMRYWQKYDQKRLAREEAGLLAIINRVQDALKAPRLDRVHDLYKADDEFHIGFKELDHYPQRGDVRYLGMFSPPSHGIAPEWPGNSQRKVFAYLHPFKQVSALLKTLTEGNFSSIVYAPEVPEAILKKHTSPNVKYSKQPLDVEQVAAQCNFAITNATFGTSAAFLLYGKPVLTIPTNLERLMGARRFAELGASIAVRPNKPEGLKPAIRSLFSSDKYTRAAQAFAGKYKDLDMAWQTEQMLKGIEDLLGEATASPKTAPPPAAGSAPDAPATSSVSNENDGKIAETKDTKKANTATTATTRKTSKKPATKAVTRTYPAKKTGKKQKSKKKRSSKKKKGKR